MSLIVRIKALNRRTKYVPAMVVLFPVAGVDLQQGRRPPAAHMLGPWNGDTGRASKRLADALYAPLTLLEP